MKEKMLQLIGRWRVTAAGVFNRLLPGAASFGSFLFHLKQYGKIGLFGVGLWMMNWLFIALWGNIDGGGRVGTTVTLAMGILLNAAAILFLWSWAMKIHIDAAVERARLVWETERKIVGDLTTANLMKQAFVDAAQFAATVAPDKPEHFDDWAVDQFALEMKKVLAHKRAEGRSGWNTDAEVDNLDFLCADHANMSEPNFVHVANYAMMVWVRNQFANACANPDLHAGPTAVQLIQEALARKE